MTTPSMPQLDPPATIADLAASNFDPMVDLKCMTRAEFLERAAACYPALAIGAAMLGKTKAELVAAVHAMDEATAVDCMRSFGASREWFERATRIFEAIETRFLIAAAAADTAADGGA